MVVKIYECEGSGTELFEALAKYPNVPKLIDAIAGCKIENYYPLWINVKLPNGENICFNDGDIMKKDSEYQKKLNKIKKLPAYIRNIPNDSMEIYADMFESELQIVLKT